MLEIAVGDPRDHARAGSVDRARAGRSPRSRAPRAVLVASLHTRRADWSLAMNKYLFRFSFVLPFAIPAAIAACATGSSAPVDEGSPAATTDAPAFRRLDVRRAAKSGARWSLAVRTDDQMRIDALDESKSIRSWTVERKNGELVVRSTTRPGVLRVDSHGKLLESTLEDLALLAKLGPLTDVPAGMAPRMVTDDGYTDDGDYGGGDNGGNNGGYGGGWSMPSMPSDNGSPECGLAIAAALAACAGVSTPVTWPAALACSSAIATASYVCSQRPSCVQSDCNWSCQQMQNKIGGACWPNAGCVCSDLPYCHPNCSTPGGGNSNSPGTSSSTSSGSTPGGGGSSCKEGSFPYSCNGVEQGCATSVMDAWESC